MTTDQLWGLAKHFSGSEAFKTMIIGALGAFFGAWGAQIIISRNQKREALVTELNSIAAALMLCFSICNIYVGLKRQMVRPLRERYDAAKTAYDEHQRALAAHQGGGKRPELHLHTDFQTITPVRAPTEQLERYVFEKISLRGRGLAAAVTLVGAIDGLGKAVQYRNTLTEEFRQASPMEHRVLIEKYLGLPNALGARDERFRSSVDAVCTLTDDCIFFSRILADDLLAYGLALRRRSVRRLRFGLPKLVGADWTAAENAGLVPPQSQYAAWLNGFPKRPSFLARTRLKLSGLYAQAKQAISAFRSSQLAENIWRLLELYFIFGEEIDRREFWRAIAGSLVLPFLGVFIASIGAPIADGAGYAFLLLWCFSLVVLATKRIRDIGWPTWLVPVYAFVLGGILWLTDPLVFLLGGVIGLTVLALTKSDW